MPVRDVRHHWCLVSLHALPVNFPSDPLMSFLSWGGALGRCLGAAPQSSDRLGDSWAADQVELQQAEEGHGTGAEQSIPGRTCF